MENKNIIAEQQNLKHWDEIAPVHYNAYFIKPLFEPDGNCLDEIQLRDLGDLTGKKVLHLQCHIGTDTLSLVRLGAEVTGVDFSENSIELARKLSKETGIHAKFIHSNVYDLQDKLDEQFDMVYTSQGVLCWLKDIQKWGQIVAKYLKPGGTFYIMETHPLRNIFDDETSEGLIVKHKYSPEDKLLHWESEYPDYADKNYIVKSSTYDWVWTVSDILNSLIQAGLTIEFFNEYSKLFFKGFPWMIQNDDGWWIFPDKNIDIPLTFTLKCTKPL